MRPIIEAQKKWGRDCLLYCYVGELLENLPITEVVDHIYQSMYLSYTREEETE